MSRTDRRIALLALGLLALVALVILPAIVAAVGHEVSPQQQCARSGGTWIDLHPLGVGCVGGR